MMKPYTIIYELDQLVVIPMACKFNRHAANDSNSVYVLAQIIVRAGGYEKVSRVGLAQDQIWARLHCVSRVRRQR